MKSFLVASLFAVGAVTPGNGLPSWQPFGLDGQTATDLVSVCSLLYATLVHVDGAGNEH